MKIETATRIRRLGKILFLLYLLVLIYLMFFFEAYDRTMENRRYLYNLVPFREIRRFILYRETLGFTVVLENVIGNIVGFIPYGFILPLIYKSKRKWWIILLLTMEFSLFIELTQLLLKVGSCDIDDAAFALTQKLLQALGESKGCNVFWVMWKTGTTLP